MHFLDIENIAFEILDYSVSYVELLGTIFGFLSVILATQANILTWISGIVNEFFLFILFFQIQLYADMLLQVYFFVITLYGWYIWKAKRRQFAISSSSVSRKMWWLVFILFGTLTLGYLFSNIHWYLPSYFRIKADYPYTDSLVMMISIVATFLLANKKIETWYLWIIVDLICVVLFFKKGIIVLGFEYLIFLGLAVYGLINWKKQMIHD